MAQVLVIRPNILIDGTGGPPRLQVPVVVQDGRILSIAPASLPEGPEVETLEGPDLCLLPGLIDAHVHLVFSGGANPLADLRRESDDQLLLRAAHNAQVALSAGITTLRDCGGRGQVVLALRDSIRAGVLTGPRIVSAGMPITTTGGHCYWLGLEADTADETRKAARAMVRAGADYLKVMATGGGMTAGTNVRAAQYSVEELAAIVAEGRRLNLKVAAHVHATAGIRNAVLAGVDTLEHCSWQEARDGVEFDERLADEIARRQVYIDPTLVAGGRRSVQPTPDLTPDRRRMQATREDRLIAYRKMLQVGIKFLAGTDAGVTLTPPDSLAENVAMLVRDLGLTNLAAIQAATQYSAEALGLADEVGTIEPGKRADLVLVEGNPLQDIGAIGRVRWVLQDGRVVARDGRLAVGRSSLPAVGVGAAVAIASGPR